MAKKGIRWAIFVALLLIVIYGSFRIITWKDTAGDYLSSMTQLYHTEDNLMDVVFVGSSHCYCGVNPAILWDQYGMAAFDMSISGQDKDSAYHALKELLKTQSPKVVCVDLFAMTFDRHLVQSNVYRNMLAIKPSKNSYELVRDYEPDDGWEDYVLRWPILHTRYRELKRFDFETYKPSTFGRGQALNFNTNPSVPPTTRDTEEVIALEGKNKKFIEGMYALSKEYDFQLVFMVLPFYFQDNEQQKINGAKQFAMEHDIPFLDMNNTDIGINYDTDFSDIDHCNYLGSDKVSAYLGEYMHSHYDLADHRGDKAYYQWDLDKKYQEHLRIEHFLLEATEDQNGKEVASLAVSTEDMVVVLSLNGDYRTYDSDVLPVIQKFGISEEEYLQGGKWVLRGNQVIARILPDSTESFWYDLNEEDTLRVENGHDSIFQDVMFNRQEAVTIYHGVGIYVYDTVLEKLVSAFGYN